MKIVMKHIVTLAFTLLPLLAFVQQMDLAEAIDRANKAGIEQIRAAADVERNALDIAVLDADTKPQLRAEANLPSYYKSSSAIRQPNGTINFLDISQDNSLASLQLSQRFTGSNTTIFAETSLNRFQDFEQGLTSFNSVPVRLGINQPLNAVNDFKWTKELLDIDNQIALSQQANVRENSAREVVISYFDLLLSQVNEEIAFTNKTNNRRLYDIAKERFTLGKISKSDLLQLELSLVSSEQSEIASKRSVVQSDSDLRTVMNYFENQEEMIIASLPPLKEAMTIDAKRASELAWNNRAFKQNVMQLVNQFNQLQDEVALASQSYAISKERYDIANQRFVLGNISITDLGLAFSERDNSWRNYIAVMRAYWVNYYTIRQLTLYDFENEQNIQ